MHTLTTTDESGGRWRIHHNGDYRGLVLIQEDLLGERVAIPAVVMLRFAAEAVRATKQSELEDASAAAVLGVGFGDRLGL